MTDICINGAGFAGLSTALLLAADGHDVVVVDREPGPPSRDPELVWDRWGRRSVPQFRQTHAYLARARQVLRSELPHVWTRLLEAGLHEHDLAGNPAATVEDRSPRPGDDDLVYVCGRRSTVESVLHHAASDDPRIDLLREVTAKGLAAVARPGDVPVVTGLDTSAGTIDAQLVIDCGGRRSPVGDWLDEAGARRPVEEAAEYRIAYWTQWFRLVPGATMPNVLGPPALEVGPIELLRIPADHGWFSITVVAPAEDRRFRVLADHERLLKFLRRLDLTADWADPQVAEPVGGVLPMFTIVDQRRRFVDGGVPCAQRLVGIGDAIAATNPSLARGTSFALMHAVWMRDLLRDGDDGVAERYEEVLDERFEPWWTSTIDTDQAHLARMRAASRGEQPDPDPGWTFQHAALHDADVWRAGLRVRGVLDLPQDVIAQPGLLEKVGATIERVGPPSVTELAVADLLAP